MNFSFSEEQEELRTYMSDFLETSLPITRVAEIADGESGWDPELSAEVAQLGWFDSDLTFLDKAVLIEEAGYALLPGTWFMSSVLLRPMLADADPLAVRIDAGSANATFAWAEGQRSASVLDLPATSARVVSETSLTGTRVLVPDAALAEVVVVPVVEGSAVVLFEVEVAKGSVRASRSLDRTRRLGEITLDGLSARRIQMVEGGVDLERLHARILTALSCEAVGVARRALDLAVTYAKERQQFDRVIGSYQGVSHRLSEVFKEIELAKSLAYRSAWAVNSDVAHEADHYVLARAAKAQAGHAAVFAAEQAIQVFGGIGITWDHPIHRWLKRAMLLSAWEGDAAHQRAEIANHLLARRAI